MASYVTASFRSQSSADLVPIGYNNGREDPNIYMKAWNPSRFTVQPSEIIRALVVPHSATITDAIASGLLADTTSTDIPNSGYYFSVEYVNETTAGQSLKELPPIKVGSGYENTLFDLYWLQTLGDDVTFGKDTSGTYSWPHNIQPEEVEVTAELTNNNTRMRYMFTFNEVTNSGSPPYGTERPYLLNVTYTNDWASSIVTGYISGITMATFTAADDWEYFSAGSATSGMIIELPYYDQRPTYSNVPAQYTFRLNYNSPLSGQMGSIPFELPLSHQQFDIDQLVALDTYVSTYTDPNKIKRIGEVPIDKTVIDRRRMSIGVNDIAVRENAYKRKGLYISKPYVPDFPIYTFHLKVDEFIPTFEGLNPYDMVKYYAEFNGRPWQQISPINRSLEFDEDGVPVPRLFVFDKDPGTETEGMKFLDYEARVVSFRLKIAFDFSQVEESRFVPPEIRDYDCIVFDKNQLLEL